MCVIHFSYIICVSVGVVNVVCQLNCGRHQNHEIAEKFMFKIVGACELDIKT